MFAALFIAAALPGLLHAAESAARAKQSHAEAAAQDIIDISPDDVRVVEEVMLLGQDGMSHVVEE